MSDMDDMAGISLADLADVDISGIDEVRFELIPMGVYVFEVVEADMVEGTNKDGDKRFGSEIAVKIIEVKSVLEAGVDKDSLVGKVITDKQFATPIKPDDVSIEAAKARFAKELGRIKATVADMGGDVTGGGIVSVVQNLRGTTFTGKVAHQTDRDDKSVKYARLRLEAAKH